MAMNSDKTLTASEGQEDDDLSSAETVHSAEQDASDLYVEVPINVFKNHTVGVLDILFLQKSGLRKNL